MLINMSGLRARRSTTPEEALEAEEKAFLRRRSELLSRYEGQYVVFYGGRLVGHGPDDAKLAGSTFEKFGDAPFYIAKVERKPTVYELPSPEL